MKKLISLLLIGTLLLTGCGKDMAAETVAPTDPGAADVIYPELVETVTEEIPYESHFDGETVIELTDSGISVNGGPETEGVYTSRDIVYYEEKTAYDSGYPYGEGSEADMHSADEAAAHLVVNITEPGAYRVSGKLSAGQIRVNLGEDACDDEAAVVELILENADITCSVAPAIVFENVYECDGEWSVDSADSDVDTAAAGAVLVLEGENKVSGSYVAKIYKDAEGEKKLWKQDGAIYSYMSMNVYGPGSLELTAENEGLDTQLHLTINGGDIVIRSGNDGINTNEDGVSVTTINAGKLYIVAGLGEEGDGIDSNGWLVINGGTVVASANPAADAGLDSDMGSYVNGGVVLALGSAMDWAESDSRQVTMNLRFEEYRDGDSAIVITQENGTEVFSFDPAADEVLGEYNRKFQGAVISTPNLVKGFAYHVHLGGAQMIYTGTDIRFVFGTVVGQAPGVLPGTPRPGAGEGERHEKPEGESRPEGMDFGGERPTMPEGETMPEEMEHGKRDEKFDGEIPEKPEGFEHPEGMNETSSTRFFMADMVNAFTGVTEAE